MRERPCVWREIGDKLMFGRMMEECLGREYQVVEAGGWMMLLRVRWRRGRCPFGRRSVGESQQDARWRVTEKSSGVYLERVRQGLVVRRGHGVLVGIDKHGGAAFFGGGVQDKVFVYFLHEPVLCEYGQRGWFEECKRCHLPSE